MKALAGKNDRKPEAESRLSVGCRNPEIVEVFSAGVTRGPEMGSRGRSDPARPDEWRKALRDAGERAAALEEKLGRAKEAIVNKARDLASYG